MSSRAPVPDPRSTPDPSDRTCLRSFYVLAGCLASVLAYKSCEAWAREPSAGLRACPRYEDEFWVVPGTDTCLRIEGGVTSDVFAHGGRVGEDAFDGDPFAISRRRTRNARVSFEASANIGFETRTATDLGTLRTSLELDTDQEKDERSLGARAGPRAEEERRGDIELDKARVQFRGFTAGLTDSFFGIDNPVNYFGTHLADFSEDLILFGYTADLSKDLSASLGIESGEVADDDDGLFDYVLSDRRVGIVDLTDERRQTPVGVANLRLDQSWGATQVSGAVGQTRTRLFSEEESPFENHKDVLGWAAAGGVALNLPQLGEDDAFVVKASFSRALTFYTVGAGGNVVWTGFDTLAKVDVFTLFAGLVHDWTPTLQSNLGVSFAHLDFNLLRGRDQAEGLTVTGNLVWSPVDDLDIGVELIYARVDAQRAASRLLETTREREGVFGAILRVERSFGP